MDIIIVTFLLIDRKMFGKNLMILMLNFLILMILKRKPLEVLIMLIHRNLNFIQHKIITCISLIMLTLFYMKNIMIILKIKYLISILSCRSKLILKIRII
jgi:hypothetical protein